MTIHLCFHSAKMRKNALFAALFATFGLSACGYGTSGPVIYPGSGGEPVFGLERGSQLEGTMTGSDKQALAEAAGSLLAGGAGGRTREWSGRSGTSGSVRLGEAYLVGLDSVAGAPVPSPLGIDTSVPLTAATGNFVTLKNANVRLGATTNAIVNQLLPEATLVRAFGQTRDGEWILVGLSDQILGYAFAELLEPTGGGDPILAGGSARRPQLCRDMWMTARGPDGMQDSWAAMACRTEDGGWQASAARGLS